MNTLIFEGKYIDFGHQSQNNKYKTKIHSKNISFDKKANK